jgi:hypothetical protein
MFKRKISLSLYKQLISLLKSYVLTNRIKSNLIKVETGTEIVAKKLWHRGDRATALDLFDLALVIEKEADALSQASQFLLKNADQFIEQLNDRREILTAQFNNIETLTYNPTYDEALKIATKF